MMWLTIYPHSQLVLPLNMLRIDTKMKSGRRFLHLLGLAGMFLFSILMTIAFVLKKDYSGFKCCSNDAFYSFFVAIGSIPWLIVGELFSQAPRSSAVCFYFCFLFLVD